MSSESLDGYSQAASLAEDSRDRPNAEEREASKKGEEGKDENGVTWENAQNVWNDWVSGYAKRQKGMA